MRPAVVALAPMLPEACWVPGTLYYLRVNIHNTVKATAKQGAVWTSTLLSLMDHHKTLRWVPTFSLSDEKTVAESEGWPGARRWSRGCRGPEPGPLPPANLGQHQASKCRSSRLRALPREEVGEGGAHGPLTPTPCEQHVFCGSLARSAWSPVPL